MPTGVYERKPFSVEHRQAISAGKKGIGFSEEHCQNLSEAKKGIPSPQKGRKRTPEQRKRIGAAHIGQVPWNKGTKGSQVPWNKGIKTGVVPWNKGQPLPSALKDRIAKTLKDKRDKLTPHTVYYLIDPITLIPRYVGFSEHPESRFEEHVKHLRGSTHKVAWISSLINAGLRPILSIRCLVDSKLEACRIEAMLITLLKARGVDLTNATPGGEGGATMTGKKFSPETCAKIGAAHKGKRLSAEHRAQISESNRTRSAETRAKMSASAKNRKKKNTTQAGRLLLRIERSEKKLADLKAEAKG